MNINIYQATTLLSRQKVLTLGLFTDGKNKEKSKYLRFFNLILDGKISNDNESMIILKYRSRSSFLKFKQRYRRKLLNYILLTRVRVDIADTTHETYLELLKLYSSARVLHLRSQKSNAVILYEYVHYKSEKYEYLDLLIFTTKFLKQHYAYVEPNKKLFKLYSEKIKKYENDFVRLNHLHHYYDDISHNNIVMNHSKVTNFKKTSLESSQMLIEGIKEDDSFEYKNKVFEIAAFANNLNENYEDSISISKKSIALNKDRKIPVISQIVLSHKDILATYLRLRDFKKAKIHLDKILELSNSINHNYFRYKSLEYSLYVMTSDYDKLYILTKEILTKKQIKDHKIHKEEWTIREAFVNILVEAGRVSPELIATSNRKFRLSRFINEVEFYSKDKRGTNISVQVIQLIHFLTRKEYDKIVDRLDALNQYTFRYLKNDDTLRSNCFIKMLLKLPEAEYHPIRTERYVAKYAKKLVENPFEISMKEIAVEIIPYEHLWEIIMEILNSNLKSKKRK